MPQGILRLYNLSIFVEYNFYEKNVLFSFTELKKLPLHPQNRNFAINHIGETLDFETCYKEGVLYAKLIPSYPHWNVTLGENVSKIYTEEQVFNLIIRALGNLRHFSLLSDINLIKNWWDKNK